MKVDAKKYARVPLAAPLMRGATYDSLPINYSLKKFFPTPGDQGEYVTSPAWAAAYAGFTAIKAIKSGVRDQQLVDSISFSPSFVYDLAKDPSDKDCQSPVSIADVLETMKNYGVLRLKDFPYECNVRIEDKDKERAAEYRISGYKRLFEEDCTSKEYAVRKALVENKPVVVGLYVARSIDDADEVWEPEAEERDNLSLAQAMTIVGYDDYKYGGAFEVLNSWGTNWGNDGYIWIRYMDLNHFCNSAYEIILDPPVEPELVTGRPEHETIGETSSTSLQGSARMAHISGATMPATLKDGVFLLQKPYMSGTRFRVEVSTKNECYVYAFASDSTYLRLYQIFPNKRSNYSPHFNGQGTFFIPGPTENYYSKLDNTVGLDYYCILFCRNELDMKKVMQSFESDDGDFYSRMKRALASDLADEDKITRDGNDEMVVATSDDKHSVLPLMVEMRHTDSDPELAIADRMPPQIVLLEPSVNLFKKDQIGGEETIAVASDKITVKGYAQDENSVRRISVEGREVTHTSDGYFETEVELTKPDSAGITISAEDVWGNRSTRTFKVIKKK